MTVFLGDLPEDKAIINSYAASYFFVKPIQAIADENQVAVGNVDVKKLISRLEEKYLFREKNEQQF